MPKYRTSAIITLVAATFGLDIAPALAEHRHDLKHTSVAELPSQTAKSAGNGSLPARIGNIWSGFDHQPTSSEVQDREKAAGISPSTARQERETATLNDIYRQLESQRLSGTAR